MFQLAIFASGTGSNAEKIIQYFKKHASIKVTLIVCNKAQAGVIGIAAKNNIPVLMAVEKQAFLSSKAYVEVLKEKKIDWIILAGFLWKMPKVFTDNYNGKIINIHPALLPKYGGKGMYGHYVHEAVILNKEKESGITIHYVDEIYDHGKVILQQKCAVTKDDDALSLAAKIHLLEHEFYAPTIEKQVTKAKDTLNQKV
jgi:phosphoribosylglycinamide formyltransferase-1